MHCDQRRRARSLDRDAFTAKIQLVGDSRCEMVLLIRERESEIVSGAANTQLLQATKKISVGIDAGIDRDLTGIGGNVVTRGFDRVPGRLEKQALLRIHDLRFARRNVEEGRVE